MSHDATEIPQETITSVSHKDNNWEAEKKTKQLEQKTKDWIIYYYLKPLSQLKWLNYPSLPTDKQTERERCCIDRKMNDGLMPEYGDNDWRAHIKQACFLSITASFSSLSGCVSIRPLIL